MALRAAIKAVLRAVGIRHRPDSELPPELTAFIQRLEHELAQRQPRVHVRGMVPGRFAIVLAVRGQELPVSLGPLFRHFASFPSAFPAAVERLMDEIEEHAIERPSDHSLAEVATDILPQVRSLDWLRRQGPAFGDGALVHRPFADDLAICYVIDDPWCMTFVCAAHLAQWGLSEDDVYHLATRNLHRRAGHDLPTPGPDDDGVLVRTGDGFDAARVLLLDENDDGLLVAMPDRDVLWLGRPESTRLARLMKLNEQQCAHAEHPVSEHLYRMSGGKLERVTASDNG